MRVLLSYNAADAGLAEALRATLFIVAPDITFVFSPTPRSVDLGQKCNAIDLREFNALLLLSGPSGLTNEQEAEWAAAVRRTVRDNEFSLLLVLVGDAGQPKQTAFLDRKWLKVPVVTDREMARHLLFLLNGQYSRPRPE